MGNLEPYRSASRSNSPGTGAAEDLGGVAESFLIKTVSLKKGFLAEKV